MQTDIGKFREYVKVNSRMEAVCKLLVTRQRSRRDATTQRVVRLLKLKGVDINRDEATLVLHTMAELGLGSMTSKRGRVTGIRWSYDPISIGKVGMGLETELKKQHLMAPREHMALPKKSPVQESIARDTIVIRGEGVTIEVPATAGLQKVSEIINAMRGT